jgi:ABC-type glycerol-3-phosphate transport system substrate-binding protein
MNRLSRISSVLIALGMSWMLVGQSNAAGNLAPRPYAGQTIVFDAQSHPSVDGLKPYISQFEKQTGIKVVVNEYPYPGIITTEQVALASHSPNFDVGMADPLYLLSWYRAGWVMKIGQLVKKVKGLQMTDFLGPAMKQMHDPKTHTLFGLPIYAETTNLMYRKDLFRSHHVAVPQTLSQMMAAAKKLDNPKKGIYGVVLRGLRGNGLNIYIWSGLFQSMGGHYFNSKGVPTVNSAAGVKATQWYAKIMDKYGPPGPSNVGWEQALSLMQQGHAAMLIDASVFAGPLEDRTASKVVGKVGYAEVPAGPAGRFPSLAAWGMFIPKGDKHVGAATKFITWALSKKVQVESAVTGSRSDVTRTSTWNSPQFKKLSNKWGAWRKVTFNSLKIASPDYRPRISNWPAVGDILGEAVSEVTSGQKSARSAMDWAEGQIKAIVPHH